MEFVKRYKLSILWAIVMLIGCTANLGNELPKEPFLPYQDKIVHFGIFGLLGFLVTYEKKAVSYHTLLLCAVYGVIIEIIQAFLPWRSFEVLDMVFDTLGAWAGILVAKFLFKKRLS